VRPPREQLGRTAAELLLEELADSDHTHRHVVFKPELIVRQPSEGSR
jgi:DNA-binding LacI/PurR family transcriptional regulator